MIQTITIYKDLDRIDVKTVIDWKQKGDKSNPTSMLKVSFSPIGEP
ncbi:hypothetical protein LLG07_05180 [bacterium]|nr:hypothetical protein [bacterium]